MNFYKRHIGDYLKDTAHLSLLEHGVYCRLLDVYYTREAGLPESQAGRLIGARSKDEVAALNAVLSEFFELIEGTWIQARCEAEITATSTKIEANRENGKKGGRPKKTKPTTEPTENPTGLPTENPLGFGSTTQNNLSQTPDSRLQTPDLKPPQSNVIAIASRDGSDDFAPKDSAQWLRYFRDRHGFEIDHTSAQQRAKAFPLFAAWTNAGITTAQMDAAIARAHAEATEPIAFLPGYADRVLVSMNAPKKAKVDAWWVSNETMIAKAKALGIPSARGGESPAAFKARIQQAIDARETA